LGQGFDSRMFLGRSIDLEVEDGEDRVWIRLFPVRLDGCADVGLAEDELREFVDGEEL